MSKPNGQPIVILMADDDADDRMLTKDALQESRVLNELRFVEDGEAVIAGLFVDALLVSGGLGGDGCELLLLFSGQ